MNQNDDEYLKKMVRGAASGYVSSYKLLAMILFMGVFLDPLADLEMWLSGNPTPVLTLLFWFAISAFLFFLAWIGKI